MKKHPLLVKPRSKRYYDAVTAACHFVQGRVPENGGHYVGTTTYLKVTPTIAWLGEEGTIPLAVRNENLGVFIIQNIRRLGMNGKYFEFRSSVMASQDKGIEERVRLTPKERGNRWDIYKTIHHTKVEDAKKFAVVTADGVTPDMVSCDLATLIPRVRSAFLKVLPDICDRNPDGWGHAYYLRGHYTDRWDGRDPIGETPMQTLKRNWAMLGIPFDPEWDGLLTQAKARIRLAA